LQRELLSLTQQSGCAVLMVTHDVDEALLLGARVLVLSTRPSRVVAEYASRRGDALAQLQLREEILRQLGVDETSGVRD
jgi:NitT/TauT family transport system ATP-binding protein